MDRKVNILGTEYTIKELTEKEYPGFKAVNAHGLCESYSKELLLNHDAVNISKPDTVDNLPGYKRETLRHEIIHAFFYEAGFDEYYHDERLTNSLAVLMPKMFKVFKELDIMD